MTKAVFLLFVILQSPTGADKLTSYPYTDAGECEYQRQWLESKGFIVGTKCAKMTYTMGGKTNG